MKDSVNSLADKHLFSSLKRIACGLASVNGFVLWFPTRLLAFVGFAFLLSLANRFNFQFVSCLLAFFIALAAGESIIRVGKYFLLKLKISEKIGLLFSNSHH